MSSQSIKISSQVDEDGMILVGSKNKSIIRPKQIEKLTDSWPMTPQSRHKHTSREATDAPGASHQTYLIIIEVAFKICIYVEIST